MDTLPEVWRQHLRWWVWGRWAVFAASSFLAIWALAFSSEANFLNASGSDSPASLSGIASGLAGLTFVAALIAPVVLIWFMPLTAFSLMALSCTLLAVAEPTGQRWVFAAFVGLALVCATELLRSQAATGAASSQFSTKDDLGTVGAETTDSGSILPARSAGATSFLFNLAIQQIGRPEGIQNDIMAVIPLIISLAYGLNIRQARSRLSSGTHQRWHLFGEIGEEHITLRATQDGPALGRIRLAEAERRRRRWLVAPQHTEPLEAYGDLRAGGWLAVRGDEGFYLPGGVLRVRTQLMPWGTPKAKNPAPDDTEPDLLKARHAQPLDLPFTVRSGKIWRGLAMVTLGLIAPGLLLTNVAGHSLRLSGVIALLCFVAAAFGALAILTSRAEFSSRGVTLTTCFARTILPWAGIDKLVVQADACEFFWHMPGPFDALMIHRFRCVDPQIIREPGPAPAPMKGKEAPQRIGATVLHHRAHALTAQREPSPDQSTALPSVSVRQAWRGPAAALAIAAYGNALLALKIWTP